MRPPGTNLPLGKLQFRWCLGLDLDTDFWFEGATNCLSSNRQITVIAEWDHGGQQLKRNMRKTGCGIGTYVKPAAFHAKVMVNDVVLDVLLFGCLKVVVSLRCFSFAEESKFVRRMYHVTRCRPHLDFKIWAPTGVTLFNYSIWIGGFMANIILGRH